MRGHLTVRDGLLHGNDSGHAGKTIGAARPKLKDNSVAVLDYDAKGSFKKQRLDPAFFNTYGAVEEYGSGSKKLEQLFHKAGVTSNKATHMQ